MIQKIDDVNRPLQVGEVFLVPCIELEEYGNLYITPVINHPHNDKENGQEEVHYHADYRFIRHINGVEVRNHSTHKWGHELRPQEKLHGELIWRVLPVVNEEEYYPTNTVFIKKSKLKHKCIHKGKCPHRGYDLSQVKPVDGVITCPLHSLQFEAESGKLLTQL